MVCLSKCRFDDENFMVCIFIHQRQEVSKLLIHATYFWYCYWTWHKHIQHILWWLIWYTNRWTWGQLLGLMLCSSSGLSVTRVAPIKLGWTKCAFFLKTFENFQSVDEHDDALLFHAWKLEWCKIYRYINAMHWCEKKHNVSMSEQKGCFIVNSSHHERAYYNNWLHYCWYPVAFSTSFKHTYTSHYSTKRGYWILNTCFSLSLLFTFSVQNDAHIVCVSNLKLISLWFFELFIYFILYHFLFHSLTHSHEITV